MPKKPRLSDATKEAIVREHKAGKGQQELARKYDCNVGYVTWLAKKYGYVRPDSRSRWYAK